MNNNIILKAKTEDIKYKNKKEKQRNVKHFKNISLKNIDKYYEYFYK